MNQINVFTGPMFSGKTNALLSAYERATIAKKRVQAFKPITDTRFGKNVIKSRRFGEIEAITIKKIEDLKNTIVMFISSMNFNFLRAMLK